MHGISVAVPTRHRPECVSRFLDSFRDSVPGNKLGPYITILLDCPMKKSIPIDCNNFYPMQVITLHDKSSLTELWNWGIITAPTDWVLLCNDDIVFKPGWLEYLEKQIATDKYDQINLGHYGAFCIHKRLVLKIGWHDERYRGGGYEDIDWQLRINEAGLKDRVDNSHTFYECRTGHDIGHFIDHFKSPSNEGWQGENNQTWICQKWGRSMPANWNTKPSRRQIREPDWHPSYTRKYSVKFNMMPSFNAITNDWGKVEAKDVYP